MQKRAVSLLLLAGMTFSLPFSAIAAPAPAAKTASNPAIQAIHKLQKIETVTYRVATDFYLYNVLNRDPGQLRKMQAQLAEGDVLIAGTGNAALQLKWNEFKRACTTAKFTAENVADNDSINAVDSTLNILTSSIRANITEQRATGAIVVDKMADMLYDEYVTMQLMTSAYLRKSADYFGGAVVASQSGAVEIDKLAAKFGTQLDQLNRYYAKNPKVAPLLKEVTTRWVFVRGSFINYNQNNVPFVIGRSNEIITDKLMAAYSTLL